MSLTSNDSTNVSIFIFLIAASLFPIEEGSLFSYPLQIKWKFEKHGIFANASFSGVITKHSRYVYRKIEIIE